MTKEHPKEADVRKKTREMLIDFGWYTFSPGTSAFGLNGISDILAMKHGRFLAVEIKIDKEQGSALQEKFMHDIRRCGGHTFLSNRRKLANGELTEFLTALDQLD